jgi:hypothetical protein
MQEDRTDRRARMGLGFRLKMTQTGPTLGRRLDRNLGARANRLVGRLPLDEYRRAKFQPPHNPRIAA